MSDDVLFVFLVDVTAKATVLLGLAFVCTRMMRRSSAAARHLVWALAVLSSLALPVLGTFEPILRVPLWTARLDSPPAAPPTAPMLPAGEPSPSAREDLRAGEASRAPANTAAAAADPQPAAPDNVAATGAPAGARLLDRWPELLLSIWMLGAALGLVLLMRRVRTLRRIVGSADPAPPAMWRVAARDAEATLGRARRPYRLCAAADLRSPWVWDLGRAVVLVPADTSGWDPARCRAAMVHELSHVRRRDCQVWLCGCVAAALYWFHPLIHLARRWLHAEQEKACDDEVLNAGCRGSEYATHLLALSSSLASRTATAAVAMARPSEMMGRLTHLLDPRRRHRAPSAARRAAIALPMLLTVAVLGTVDACSTAGEEPPADPQAASPQDPIGKQTPGEKTAKDQLAAAVRKQTSQLADPELRAVSIEALHGLGERALPYIIRELDVEKDRGATPTASGLVEALSKFERLAGEARPALEELATQSVPLRRLAIPALARLRGEGGRTLIADYSGNRIIAVDDQGREVFVLEEVYGAWDVELLADGNLLITEFALSRVVEVTPDGKKVWRYERLKNPYDADRLPNGNTLIADTFGERVVEVDPAGKTIWVYDGGIKPYDVERLANGNTLIADGRKDRLIEVDPTGKIVWEVPNMPGVHDVDALDDGHLLVTTRALHSVVEIDRKGKIVWKLESLSSPSDADRLPNGNTLVAENGKVAEYDPDGKLVWQKKVAWAVEVNRY